MWAALSTRITRIVGVIGVVLMALTFAYSKGRGDQKEVERVHELQEYKRIREKVDEVDPSPDRRATVRRLRSNGIVR